MLSAGSGIWFICPACPFFFFAFLTSVPDLHLSYIFIHLHIFSSSYIFLFSFYFRACSVPSCLLYSFPSVFLSLFLIMRGFCRLRTAFFPENVRVRIPSSAAVRSVSYIFFTSAAECGSCLIMFCPDGRITSFPTEQGSSAQGEKESL